MSDIFNLARALSSLAFDRGVSKENLQFLIRCFYDRFEGDDTANQYLVEWIRGEETSTRIRSGSCPGLKEDPCSGLSSPRGTAPGAFQGLEPLGDFERERR